MAFHLFAVTDDLCVNVEGTADFDDAFSGLLVGVDFHAVSHVEDFVHFFPVGAALFVNHAEQWRNGEEVVLYYVEVIYKVQHLGLSAAAAMNHAVNLGTVFVEDATDDRRIGTGGGEHHLAGIYARNFGGVGETLAATIDHLLRKVVVVAHWEMLGVVF